MKNKSRKAKKTLTERIQIETIDTDNATKFQRTCYIIINILFIFSEYYFTSSILYYKVYFYEILKIIFDFVYVLFLIFGKGNFLNRKNNAICHLRQIFSMGFFWAKNIQISQGLNKLITLSVVIFSASIFFCLTFIEEHSSRKDWINNLKFYLKLALFLIINTLILVCFLGLGMECMPILILLFESCMDVAIFFEGEYYTKFQRAFILSSTFIILIVKHLLGDFTQKKLNIYLIKSD